MKKFLTLFLSVLLLSGILTCTGSATETSTTADDQIAVSTLDDYVEVHTFDECHKTLHEMIDEAGQQSGDGDVAPYALIHCQSSAGIGRYIEQLVSTTTTRETRNCTHGAVGVIDVRTVYTDVYRQYCTLCDYESSYSVTRYGVWTCKG